MRRRIIILTLMLVDMLLPASAFEKARNKYEKRARNIPACSILFSLILVIVSCDPKPDITPLPPLSPNDISVSYVLDNPSAYWLTNGDDFTVKFKGIIDYMSSRENLELTYLKIEKDSETLVLSKYVPNCTLTTKVKNWAHGENEVKIYAVFNSDGQEIIKEISIVRVLVFNELPKYDIEGRVTMDIMWVAQTGESFSHYVSIESKNHIFKYYFDNLYIASSGEVFRSDRLRNFRTNFFINESSTNFNAKITQEELHWYSQDGPTELPSDEELGDDVSLYASFTVEGEHEGINISQKPTIIFKFIREKE